jgi:hypothetical protein
MGSITSVFSNCGSHGSCWGGYTEAILGIVCAGLLMKAGMHQAAVMACLILSFGIALLTFYYKYEPTNNCTS